MFLNLEFVDDKGPLHPEKTYIRMDDVRDLIQAAIKDERARCFRLAMDASRDHRGAMCPDWNRVRAVRDVARAIWRQDRPARELRPEEEN